MKGKARTTSLSQSSGLVEGLAGGPSWDFIYQVSTVKHPNFFVGDRVQLPDGRVFRYSKSSGICYTGQGNRFYDAIPAVGIDYKVLTANAPKGQAYVKTLAIVTHTADDLRGGHALFKPTNTSGNDVLQMRLITGNTATAIGSEMVIYLDASLSADLTTASYIVCMPCPWGNIKQADSEHTGVAGLAATYVDATGKYFWCQTWGLCWIAGQAELGVDAHKRQLVFRADGSVGPHDYEDALEGMQQHAGFIVDNNHAGNGMTKMMLQICP